MKIKILGILIMPVLFQACVLEDHIIDSGNSAGIEIVSLNESDIVVYSGYSLKIKYRINNIEELALQYSTDLGNTWIQDGIFKTRKSGTDNLCHIWKIPEVETGNTCLVRFVNTFNPAVRSICSSSFRIKKGTLLEYSPSLKPININLRMFNVKNNSDEPLCIDSICTPGLITEPINEIIQAGKTCSVTYKQNLKFNETPLTRIYVYYSTQKSGMYGNFKLLLSP